jgi:hypothetical protein
MSPILISVHMPKTAGTTLLDALGAHFKDALRGDYVDFPINTPERERHEAALRFALEHSRAPLEGVNCIHGHFLPLKYLTLEREPVFVTWLRDPVDRLISHYRYWYKIYDATAKPLHRKVVEEKWSLVRFCLSPELRNLYTQFLWGFPIQNFAFIGVVERFVEDFGEFSRRYLGSVAIPAARNVSEQRPAIEPSFRREVAAFHALDMELYEYALTRRR